MDRINRSGPDNLRFCCQDHHPPDLFDYRIAGRRLTSGLEFPHLGGYRISSRSSSDRAGELDSADPGRQVFSGAAFLGGRERHLECRVSDRAAALEIEQLGNYRLDLTTRLILLRAPFPAPEAVEQALCGPCLALTLAAGGTFLLHAGAIGAAGRAIALTGTSGAGKSTLVAALGETAGLRALADDALPLEGSSETIRVPGAYPQLKWPEWGAGAALDAPVELVGVVELAPGGDGVRSEPLESGEALLTVVRHTIAARLFGPALLKQHFLWCREVAAAVPFVRLRYARELRNLPLMVDEILKLWRP